MIGDTISFLLLVAAFWALVIITQIVSEQNRQTGTDEDVAYEWRMFRLYSRQTWCKLKEKVRDVRHR